MSTMSKKHSKKGGGSQTSITGNVTSRVFTKVPNIIVSIPRQFQMFPPRYRCFGKMVVTAQFNSVVNSLTFKLNSLWLFGPQLNYAGAFGQNVPAGVVNLISSPNVLGAEAPYSRVVIKSMEVTARCANNMGASSVNVVPYNVDMAFTTTSSMSGMNTRTIREQPMVVWMDVPAGGAEVYTLKAKTSACTVFGVKESVYLSDEDYAGAAVSDPANLAYVHVTVSPLDGVSVIYSFIELEFDVEYDFFNRNTLNSDAPT